MGFSLLCFNLLAHEVHQRGSWATRFLAGDLSPNGLCDYTVKIILFTDPTSTYFHTRSGQSFLWGCLTLLFCVYICRWKCSLSISSWAIPLAEATCWQQSFSFLRWAPAPPVIYSFIYESTDSVASRSLNSIKHFVWLCVLWQNW